MNIQDMVHTLKYHTKIRTAVTWRNKDVTYCSIIVKTISIIATEHFHRWTPFFRPGWGHNKINGTSMKFSCAHPAWYLPWFHAELLAPEPPELTLDILHNQPPIGSTWHHDLARTAIQSSQQSKPWRNRRPKQVIEKLAAEPVVRKARKAGTGCTSVLDYWYSSTYVRPPSATGVKEGLKYWHWRTGPGALVLLL